MKTSLRALLELYQDMPLQILTKELNDMDSYRRLEEDMRFSNKELTFIGELLEGVQSMKKYATIGKYYEILSILSDDVGLMKPPWCPNSNAGLIWDLTAEVELKKKMMMRAYPT